MHGGDADEGARQRDAEARRRRDAKARRRHLLAYFSARARVPWPRLCARLPLLAVRRRRPGPLDLRSGTQRRLARMDGRPPARHRPGTRPGRLSDAHADHGRRLPRHAGGHPRAVAARARAGDPRRKHHPAARSAADLPGRVRLHRLCAPGRAARPEPVHLLPRAGANRPGLPLPRLALPALPLRTPLHARQLRHRAARARRCAVGVQDRRRALQPGRSGARRRRGEAHGRRPALRSRVRRPEPGPAGAGRRRRAQRHARHAAARTHSRSHRQHSRRRARAAHPWATAVRTPTARRGEQRDPLPSPQQPCDRLPRRGRRRQGLGRPRAPLPRALPPARARPRALARRRGREPRGSCPDRRDRLRRRRARVPRRPARPAADGRHAQHPRRERPPLRPHGHPHVVAQRLPRRLPASAGAHAVAHLARRRLARAGRLGDARAAARHRVAFAVVCDLGAAASGARRQPPSARGHARLLRVCPAHPPAARQAPAQPAAQRQSAPACCQGGAT